MAFTRQKRAWKNDRKIDPSSLAFDVDGVCADTMGLFLNILEHDFGVNGIRAEDIKCYSLEKCLDLDREIIEAAIDKILLGDYSFELRPLSGAIEVLTRVGQSGGKLLFVTARPDPGLLGSWLRGQIPVDPDTIEVVATGAFEAKAQVLLDRNISHFVEDRLDACFSLSEAGIVPLLMAQPWNRERHPFLEVENWIELRQLIDM